MKPAPARRSVPIGATFIVLSSLFYASYGIWTKLMGDYFAGYTASALRSVLVLAILVPAMLLYRQWGSIRWRHNWHYLAGLVLASTLIWGPLYYAILHAGIGVSLAINYICLVGGMFFFGWLMAGERLTRDKWLSAGLGLIGLGLIFSPSFVGAGWVALVAAAVSGLSTAFNIILMKKLPYSPTQTVTLSWGTSVIANVPMAFLLHEPLPAIGWHMPWFYLVMFAVASVAASWLFVRGIKLIDAGAAGVLGLLEIVFGVVFGVMFFGERLSMVVLLGVAVIIVAAAIPYAKEYQTRREVA